MLYEVITQAPDFTNDYRIPPLRQAGQPGLLGSQVDVRPPVQILNLTPGSRGEFSQDAVSLWFSPRSVNQKLDQELWELLFSFLTERNIPVASMDPGSKRLDTSWFATTPTMETWTDESDDKLMLRQRYRFSVENEPGLHRTALKLQLLQQESYLDGEKSAAPSTHRITSYNVCYTKLLRQPDAGLHSRYAHRSGDRAVLLSDPPRMVQAQGRWLRIRIQR